MRNPAHDVLNKWKWPLMIGILAVLAVSVPVFCRLTGKARAARTETIYTGVTLHGVDVGGLTRQEAEQKLLKVYQPILEDKSIRLTVRGETVAVLTFKDFGARYDFSAPVEQAWQYGRTDARERILHRITAWVNPRTHEINVPPAYTFEVGLIETRLKAIADKTHIPPVNARMTRDNGQFIVTPGTDGQTLDAEEAASRIHALLLAQQEGEVPLSFKPVAPRYTTADFTFKKSLIGRFETPYYGRDDDPRCVNLRVAAGRLNNRLLYPGEVFSAAAALETNRPEHGYARATVIVDGRAADDLGGGVCQAVTAVYNAALDAELQIVERFNHSMKVSYADYGYDATVAGDYFDLKIKNNTPHPLLLACSAENGVFTAELYGYEVHEPGRMIRFVSELTEVLPPSPDKVLNDAGLSPGDTVVVLEARDGYRYELYKYIYQNGQPVGCEKVNSSVYKPVQGIVAVGG